LPAGFTLTVGTPLALPLGVLPPPFTWVVVMAAHPGRVRVVREADAQQTVESFRSEKTPLSPVQQFYKKKPSCMQVDRIAASDTL
jgi:hypothetical protein